MSELAPDLMPLAGAPIRASRLHVDVWQVRLALERSEADAALRTLNASERAHALLLRSSADQWVAGRAALRGVLGRYLCVEPTDVEMVNGADGKPRLECPDRLDLRFNLSHSGDVALIAVRLGFDVGVDIEMVREGVDGSAIAHALFSADERSEMTALAMGMDEREAFFRSWVRHEALAKATGWGIASPVGGSVLGRYAVRDLDGIGGYAAAIASVGDDWSVALLP